MESKLYTETPVLRRKSIPRYKINISCTNGTMDYINVIRVLRSKDGIHSRPGFVE